jgi:electron transport complex protein RnfB
MTPNRFLAVVDEDKCTGCQDCIDRCKFEAVDMEKSAHSKKFKASISAEKCKGCGLCIITCKQNAITYEIVRPPEYLKPKPSPSSKPSGPVHVIPVWGHYNLK